MIPLPRWAWPFLLDKLCPHCGAKTTLSEIESVGVRQKEMSKKIEKGNALLIFDYNCGGCRQKSTWEADPDDRTATIRDVLMNVLEVMDLHMGRRSARTPNKVSGSKITNKELQNFRKSLAKFTTHDEFLAYIGLSVEEIEKFKKDRKNDGDQNK